MIIIRVQQSRKLTQNEKDKCEQIIFRVRKADS